MYPAQIELLVFPYPPSPCTLHLGRQLRYSTSMSYLYSSMILYSYQQTGATLQAPLIHAVYCDVFVPAVPGISSTGVFCSPEPCTSTEVPVLFKAVCSPLSVFCRLYAVGCDTPVLQHLHSWISCFTNWDSRFHLNRYVSTTGTYSKVLVRVY